MEISELRGTESQGIVFDGLRNELKQATVVMTYRKNGGMKAASPSDAFHLSRFLAILSVVTKHEINIDK